MGNAGSKVAGRVDGIARWATQREADAPHQHTTFHTDDWEAYKGILPAGRHRYGKQKKHTNRVERFFCTLRQRASRLVRLSLSFSKKLEQHIRLIKLAVTNYNPSLQT